MIIDILVEKLLKPGLEPGFIVYHAEEVTIEGTIQIARDSAYNYFCIV